VQDGDLPGRDLGVLGDEHGVHGQRPHGAIRRRHAVVTSNSAHIKKVAGAAGVTFEIHV